MRNYDQKVLMKTSEGNRSAKWKFVDTSPIPMAQLRRLKFREGLFLPNRAQHCSPMMCACTPTHTPLSPSELTLQNRNLALAGVVQVECSLYTGRSLV